MTSARLYSVESARALGAFMVVFYHVINIQNSSSGAFMFPQENLRSYCEFGAQGVNLLFMVSGTVVYYTLFNRNYTLKNFVSFFKRRMTRILIPFWVTLLGFALVQLAYHQAYPYSWKQLVGNALLAIPMDKQESWINPIFLTLQLEVIFYILVGLTAELFIRKPLLLWIAGALGIVGAYFFHDNPFLIRLPYFLIGMFLALFVQQSVKPWYWLGVVPLVAYVILAYSWYDIFSVLVYIVLILFTKKTPKWVGFFSEYSYSLFLTHGLSLILVGTVLFTNGYAVWISLSIALLAATFVTIGFYRFIEKPATKWSKRY